MSKLKLFCILAVAVLIAVPAYAEVQNVKVSGDMAARWIMRWDYDLDKDNATLAGSSVSNAADDFLLSTAEVQVDADLTDNVSTVLRLVNQRNWGEANNEKRGTVAQTQYDVIVDLANVTFKEFFYSPLTVTVGRQDLWYGKGFIIGAKQRDPKASIAANEYTAINSFDAIKATLDFDPWKIDAVYTLLEETTTNVNDDMWLVGANVGYKFDSYNAEAEIYTFNKIDRSRVAWTNAGTASVAAAANLINVYGLRGSLVPITNLTVAAEGAIQKGRYNTSNTNASRSRSAWALDLSGEYLFQDVKWTPKLGLEWIAYSGDSDYKQTGSGDFEGWDPIYRGKFDTAIREFQNVYYITSQRAADATSVALDPVSGVTNQYQFLIIGQVKPINNLTIDGRFAWFRLADAQIVGSETRNKEIGNELDLQLTYDYTEDVSFNLLAAWFFPGKYWLNGQDDTATDLVGAVKVAF